MNTQAKNSLGAIYFDGLCRACSAEIEHYRKLPGAERFAFVDISDTQFDAAAHNVDPYLVNKVMHVRDPEGTLHQGVDAFRAIWRELPRYQFLHRASAKQPVRALLEIGYKAFVVIRPYLPRKKSACSASQYCELNNV